MATKKDVKLVTSEDMAEAEAEMISRGYMVLTQSDYQDLKKAAEKKPEIHIFPEKFPQLPVYMRWSIGIAIYLKMVEYILTLPLPTIEVKGVLIAAVGLVMIIALINSNGWSI